MGMVDRIDAHLHLARISSFPPARLADPIILLSFGGWSSAVVSGRGLHVYGCMVFGTILSPPSSYIAAVSDRHNIVQSVHLRIWSSVKNG